MVKLASLCLALSLAGCMDDKGLEQEAPEDGKLDSFRTPTDHGQIAFYEAQVGKLTADQRHHTWSFSLGAPATVTALTSRKPHEASIDTVLYLYRKGATGWGPYIARNDDDGRNEWSSLTRDLESGDYRVLVKGFSATTRGWFGITTECTGNGCSAPVPCLLGSSFYELFHENPDFVTISQTAHTSPQGLSALDAERVVLAVKESSHDDVTTAAEAFSRVDQNEIMIRMIEHTPSGRTFATFDYGAGDNTYGAIFVADTADIAVAIHDGDFYRCSVQ